VRHLLSRTAALQQAGGASLMALRGHTAAVRAVVISPDGRDVLTASDDGAVQVRAASRAGRSLGAKVGRSAAMKAGQAV
jgi:WD40 repeat protein